MRNAGVERITYGELQDDLLEYAKSKYQTINGKIWWLVVEATLGLLRPHGKPSALRRKF
jgi:hypothetical protein